MLEKWSLGYWLLKKYVTRAYWFFHRRIVIMGRENIPQGKPVIFAPNHPNTLNDDISVAYGIPHQTVWLGRASLFNSRWARPFLRLIKIVPVYRIRDGLDSLKGNEASFATAVRVLQHNKALGLYPEAGNSENRKMLPHKKAISRIVFLAADMTRDTLDIQIVPVGLHYDQYPHFGRRLMVTFGKPLAAKDYYPLYRQNPHQATLGLRDDIYRAILPLALNYETKDFIEGFEAIRAIAGKPFARRQGFPDTMPGQLHGDQALTARLDTLATSNPTAAAALAEKGITLLHDFQKNKLRSWLADQQEEKVPTALLYSLGLLITLPLFLYGWILNIIPFAGLGSIVKKRAKDPIWISTFTFGLGIVVFPLFYFLELLLAAPLLQGWLLKILFLISLPFAGKFAFVWYITFLKTLGRWRWLIIKRRKPDVYRNLQLRKEEIISKVQALPGIQIPPASDHPK